mmetsp:Transcript_12815/g.18434  ORF Transcript_12815/g.18434 Transcript_12815/m.18434 type:complete len:143 (+) Transcript_12815:281-709(+)
MTRLSIHESPPQVVIFHNTNHRVFGEYENGCINFYCKFDYLQLIMFLPFIKTDEAARTYCLNLQEQLSKTQDIPMVCRKFPDVLKDMEKRINERDAAIAFKGMRAGSGNQARRARSRGGLTHTQIQRRYTQTRRFSKNDQEK